MPSEDDRVESWQDDRLLREANNGNDDAFHQFCVRAIPGLLRYCRYQCRRFRAHSMAGDFCQEAIQKALECVRTCREPGGRPLPKVSAAWLKQIAYNSIIDWNRRSQRVRLVDEFVGHLDAASPQRDVLEEREEQEHILKFFDWLQGNDRDMLELVLVEELPITEAGDRLGLSRDASYKAYQRSLRRLQDLLAEHGIAPDCAER